MFEGNQNHRPLRLISSTMATIMLINTVPQNAFAKPRKVAPHIAASRLKPGLTQTPDPALRKKIEAIEAQQKKASQPDVRLLSDSEEATIKGRGPLRNKYYSGTMPWHRSFHDVNLNTGNLFKSFTDVQVAPGKGAGLALQRTYNSNDEREGPFGIGWTHAYDIRMEEAPQEKDPETDNEIVPRTDFFGGKHKYQRDADGLYSPPAYLFDTMDSNYDKSLVDGPPEVLEDKQTGMDDTIKHFVPEGVDADGSPSATRVCDYIEDRHGNRTVLTYGLTTNKTGGGTRKLLTKVTDPTGRELNFIWTNIGNSGSWRITKVTGPQYEVIYGYNAEKNLQSVTLDPTGLNRTTTFGYTTLNAGNGNVESGLLTSVTDNMGHSVTYTYEHTPYSTGQFWVTRVNETGTGGVEWAIDPAEYDSGSNQFASRFRAVGYSSMSACFMDFSLRTTMFRAQNGQYGHHSWQYDTDNNVIADGLSNITYYDPVVGGGMSQSSATTVTTYGPHGNVLTQSQTGYPGVTTTQYYDASKYFQKKKIIDPMGRVTEFDYFEKAKYVDPNNPNNPANVGRQGNVAWVKDAKASATGKKFEYDYNTYGQKVWEKNLNDVVSTFEYADTWGNLTKVRQDPTGLNRTTQMSYDVSGKVLSSTDPMGQTSTFAYNTLGQPTSAAFPAKGNIPGETISYAYGVNGRTESVTDNRGTTTMAYLSGTDRVASVTDPVTGTISYTYTPFGERKTMTAPNGETTTYHYKGETTEWMPWLGLQGSPDSWTRNLEKITDPQGRVVQMAASSLGIKALYFNQAFDSAGNRTAYCVTQYNTNEGGPGDRGRLQEIKTLYRWKSQYGYSWNEKLLSKNNYTYNVNGLRTTNTITDSNNTARTETYAYDELSRLTGVAYGDGQTQGYSFDNMGNRLAKTDNVTGNETYGYNNANMLLNRNGQGYTNDANGNTLTGGGRTSTWDSQNRMVQCVYNNKTSNFTYGSDHLRRRMSVTNADGTTTTDYILDGQNIIQELAKLPGQSNYSLTATYLQGASGPMYRRGASVADARWYVYDGLGSVLGEVDVTGNLTSTKKHDVYGIDRGITGNPTSKHGFVGQLGHTSEDETGLIYMRARYYDTIIGRFISEDPAKDSVNWFNYCRNSPTNLVDKSGKSPLDTIGPALTLYGYMQNIMQIAVLIVF